MQDVKLEGSPENLTTPQSGDFLKSPTSLEVDQSNFINQFMKKGAKKELDLNNLRDELTRFHQKKSNGIILLRNSLTSRTHDKNLRIQDSTMNL